MASRISFKTTVVVATAILVLPTCALNISPFQPHIRTPCALTQRSPPATCLSESPLRSRRFRSFAQADDGMDGRIKPSEQGDQTESKPTNDESSKREMLKFAIPALGIYLTSPLLSNIDNAFVGRTVGPTGLAALSPATLCTDQMLYLFLFLSRATTGLVSRAYYSKEDATEKGEVSASDGDGNIEKARNAASPPFTVSIISGICVSILCTFFTPNLLRLLNVDPLLLPSASSYVYLRGTVAWAALAQSIFLSIFMVTKDATTPLKIIGFSALANVVLDSLFCAWPLRTGCAGAAAATAIATLWSSIWMGSALHKRNLLPKFRFPSKKEVVSLLEFTGPLLFVTLTRLAGFLNMQRTAMKLGMTQLAGYQLCINLVVFFLLFGEPLSQLCQTQLPPLMDSEDGERVSATFKSILVLSSLTAAGVGGVAYLTALFGSGMFSSDLGVQAVAKSSAPMVFLTVAQAIVTVAVDGAMLASRDFGVMLACGLSSFTFQLQLLKRCTTIGGILNTFTMRLASYTFFVLLRAATGFGPLGRVMKGNKRKKKVAVETATA